jgi:hypothetical protein
MAGILHATMEEVESGLFHIAYTTEMNGTDQPSGGQLPDSHIGTNRNDMRAWVE